MLLENGLLLLAYFCAKWKLFLCCNSVQVCIFSVITFIEKRNYNPGAGGRKSPRVSRCFSPPPPHVERVVRCAVSEEFYTKKQSDQVREYAPYIL